MGEERKEAKVKKINNNNSREEEKWSESKANINLDKLNWT